MTQDEIKSMVERRAYLCFQDATRVPTGVEWIAFAQQLVNEYGSAGLRADDLEVQLALAQNRLLEIEREAWKAGRAQLLTELRELFDTLPVSEDEPCGIERVKVILQGVQL